MRPKKIRLYVNVVKIRWTSTVIRLTIPLCPRCMTNADSQSKIPSPTHISYWDQTKCLQLHYIK